MVINHNLNAMNAYRSFSMLAVQQAKHIERLSSGLRINRAADDAAGLTISERMRSQIRGINQASRNAQDSISMIQTAEGSLGEVHNMLQRANELAVQAANDTNGTAEREAINAEFQELMEEIDRIGGESEFNSRKLFDGSSSEANELQIQIGANKGNVLSLSIGKVNSESLGIDGVDLTTQDGASIAITSIQGAVEHVSKMRSSLGAKQNRLEHTIKNLDNTSENLQAAESRIRDADIAKEMMAYTKINILMQASQFMIAQANQQPQSILSMLR